MRIHSDKAGRLYAGGEGDIAVSLHDRELTPADKVVFSQRVSDEQLTADLDRHLRDMNIIPRMDERDRAMYSPLVNVPAPGLTLDRPPETPNQFLLLLVTEMGRRLLKGK